MIMLYEPNKTHPRECLWTSRKKMVHTTITLESPKIPSKYPKRGGRFFLPRTHEALLHPTPWAIIGLTWWNPSLAITFRLLFLRSTSKSLCRRLNVCRTGPSMRTGWIKRGWLGWVNFCKGTNWQKKKTKSGNWPGTGSPQER